MQDYLTVWDGATRDSPVLVRLCGGDAVPDIVSRGPNMLLEFHTSPYDNPFHPVPLSYLPGFELEVQVRFSDCRYYVRVLETTDLNLFCAFVSVWLRYVGDL